MWNEKIIKIIPAVLFLFSLLESFELCLGISDLNRIERLETEIRKNLKALEDITVLLREYLERTDLEHFKDDGGKIK
ncbi:hypothetical protein HpHCM43_14750 [Helicobacter pylori]